ncbi:hypothetical protein, conserved [Trypanosoma brucei gambiense DAL972]|uniref:RING-type domain-containing protein n=2 Tax=Trypanosoma brucei TaxID=5691 RepID=C9ZPW1_TRYB9|nr:hypothetical protein, conserved [Trypanosoma brucei gambiense DAL972]RHW72389.1 zinc finger protein [Trypanosoma brucei equiperdum]CBH11439.1 hypothetical protein, conserved [Trypanosoma brucei gambiense DAL972]|eukprot:XP_011773726.1 hypothetical protein, conserved [Trypanosoma brucei gambiense DAL972]
MPPKKGKKLKKKVKLQVPPQYEEQVSKEPVSDPPTSQQSITSLPISVVEAALAVEESPEEDIVTFGAEALNRLLSMRHPQQIAADLTRSLSSLRQRLAQLEMEWLGFESSAVGSTYACRARDQKDKLEHEVRKTEKMTRHLILLGRVLDRIFELRTSVFDSERTAMEAEVEELTKRVEKNDEEIRSCYINRISLLHRYWVWRTLQELGDMTVGRTFAEELARGPRYRSIAIQNRILSDTLERQLEWLQRFLEKEEVFCGRVRQLERFVEEFTDMNDALEEVLTCRVCNLLFEDPVVFWPCGHSFCLQCFDSLSVAPSLFRCPLCGSMGSEGYVHNLLLSESVAKWMFKDACYADVHGALSLVRLHLSKFRRNIISSRMEQLEERLTAERGRELASDTLDDMDIVYRAY